MAFPVRAALSAGSAAFSAVGSSAKAPLRGSGSATIAASASAGRLSAIALGASIWHAR